MQGNDDSECGRWTPVSDAWWAALAGAVLHPVQVQIIEALRHIDRPLTVWDLSEIVFDVEPVHLDYHLGRLRRLGVLDHRRATPYGGFMDMRFQMAKKRPRYGRG